VGEDAVVIRRGRAKHLVVAALAALLQEAADVPFEDAARCMADAVTAPMQVWSMQFPSQNDASEHFFRLCIRSARLNLDRRSPPGPTAAIESNGRPR
jgi:hypothetical protein